MRKCLFAGSFDPVTTGHVDVIKKCSEMFDLTYVALMINPDKNTFFSEEDRFNLLKKATEGIENVKVIRHNGLVVDLMREEGIKYNVRGIRNSTDYDYETIMTYINQDMNEDIVTIYIPTTQELLHVSSSLVRSVVAFNGNVDKYIPSNCLEDFKKILNANK